MDLVDYCYDQISHILIADNELPEDSSATVVFFVVISIDGCPERAGQ
jgi:hypothetical protein